MQTIQKIPENFIKILQFFLLTSLKLGITFILTLNMLNITLVFLH